MKSQTLARTFEIMARTAKRKSIMRRASFLAAAGALFSLASTPAFSCAVCFGDPSSPMVHGAKAGVLVLAGVIYFQLMLMGGVAAFWYFRARKLSREQSLEEQ